MADEHKVSGGYNENLLRLLVDGCRVGGYSADRVGGIVNVDVVQRSALCIHKCDEDVHDVEWEHSRGAQSVEATCRASVVNFDAIGIRLICPVLQALQLKPLAHLLLSKLDDSNLFLGIVCASESCFPVFNHFNIKDFFWC